MASTSDTFDYQAAADDALQAWGEYLHRSRSDADSGPTRNPVTLHTSRVKMTYSKTTTGSDGLPRTYHWDLMSGDAPPAVTSVLCHSNIAFFTDIVLASPLSPGGPGTDREDSTVVGTFILTTSVGQGAKQGEPRWRVLVEQSKDSEQLHYLSGDPFQICGHASQKRSMNHTTQGPVYHFDSTLPSWSGDLIPFFWARDQSVIVPSGVTFDGKPGSLATPVVLRYSPTMTTDEQGKITRECDVLAYCVPDS
jgi:hypothetical protein